MTVGCRQETRDKRQETGDTGEKIQETRDGRYKAGDRRQESGDSVLVFMRVALNAVDLNTSMFENSSYILSSGTACQ